MKQHAPVPERAEHAARVVVDAAFRVHSALGPGLLESVYEACLAHELRRQGVPYVAQQVLPVVYDGLRLDAGLRIDLLVDESIVVELKAVEKILAIHEAQLLTYMKLADKRLGLLVNFNVSLIRDGIKRMVL
ncbi:MAG TPA: GxxExxY protein [Phycisphaerae bacterium]|nr:GxxExxY protein [Phycisphaerae bacterium]HNU46108.1 GxxExxY protein [Phycisphaerae bacterium]